MDFSLCCVYPRMTDPSSTRRIVDGLPVGSIAPGMAGSALPKYLRSSQILCGGGSPAGFALVETNGPPNAEHSVAKAGDDVTRIATSSLSPVIQRGKHPLWGTSQVFGPGQDASIVSRCSDDRSLSTLANTSLLAPTTIRPLLTSRCFIANRSKTAPSSKGSQLSPHTPSAGHATTPPAQSDAANWGARQRECSSGLEFNGMPAPYLLPAPFAKRSMASRYNLSVGR